MTITTERSAALMARTSTMSQNQIMQADSLLAVRFQRRENCTDILASWMLNSDTDHDAQLHSVFGEDYLSIAALTASVLPLTVRGNPLYRKMNSVIKSMRSIAKDIETNSEEYRYLFTDLSNEAVIELIVMHLSYFPMYRCKDLILLVAKREFVESVFALKPSIDRPSGRRSSFMNARYYTYTKPTEAETNYDHTVALDLLGVPGVAQYESYWNIALLRTDIETIIAHPKFEDYVSGLLAHSELIYLERTGKLNEYRIGLASVVIAFVSDTSVRDIDTIAGAFIQQELTGTTILRNEIQRRSAISSRDMPECIPLVSTLALTRRVLSHNNLLSSGAGHHLGTSATMAVLHALKYDEVSITSVKYWTAVNAIFTYNNYEVLLEGVAKILDDKSILMYAGQSYSYHIYLYVLGILNDVNRRDEFLAHCSITEE